MTKPPTPRKPRAKRLSPEGERMAQWARLSPEALAVAEAWDALRARHPNPGDHATQYKLEYWPNFDSRQWQISYYTPTTNHLTTEADDLPSLAKALKEIV